MFHTVFFFLPCVENTEKHLSLHQHNQEKNMFSTYKFIDKLFAIYFIHNSNTTFSFYLEKYFPPYLLCIYKPF